MVSIGLSLHCRAPVGDHGHRLASVGSGAGFVVICRHLFQM